MNLLQLNNAVLLSDKVKLPENKANTPINTIEKVNFKGTKLKDISAKHIKSNFIPVSFGSSFLGTDGKLNKLNISIDNAIVYGKNPVSIDQMFETFKKPLTAAVKRTYNDIGTPGQWLKWVILPKTQLEKVKEIQDYVDNNVRNKFDDVVVLGIGGSSLGAKALLQALSHSSWNDLPKEQRNGLPRIHFIENIDPDSFHEKIESLDLNKTLINVVSKSGTTPETSATFLNLQEQMIKAVGKDKARENIVAITDTDASKSVLKQVSTEEGYKTFVVPDDVGGRYSVLSDVGLLPAAFAGINIEELLKGAHDMARACENTTDLKKNPAASQALVQYLNYEQGKNYSVMMPYSDKLCLISDWYAQLWGESLGKKKDKDGNQVNINHSPVRALGAIDQHSQLQLWREGKNDKVFTFLTVDKFEHDVAITKDPANIPDKLAYMKHNSLNDLIKAEAEATQEVLISDGRPVVKVSIPKIDEYHIGQILQMFMTETAILGELHNLGINTYLQPAVEDGKIITKEKMTKLSNEKAAKLDTNA